MMVIRGVYFKLILLLILGIVLAGCGSAPKNSSPNSKRVFAHSDKAMVHAQLGKSYLQQKQYAVAKSELEKALRIESNHSESNYVMALLMMELGDYEVAEGHFQRAVRYDRENSAAAHDFGMFLCQTNQQVRAIEYFEIAAGNPLFGRSELSYMRAGECLEQINDDRAEKYLKRALSIDPQLRPALYRLAFIKYQASSYLSARAYIERYMAITKPQPAALLLAYKIELQLNATDVADRYRSQILEDFPGSEQASSLRVKQPRTN